MAQKEEKQPEVKFITSIAIAVRDINDEVQHVQIVLVQEVESMRWRVMFDVVDPTKIPRFAEENELPETDTPEVG